MYILTLSQVSRVGERSQYFIIIVKYLASSSPILRLPSIFTNIGHKVNK